MTTSLNHKNNFRRDYYLTCELIGAQTYGRQESQADFSSKSDLKISCRVISEQKFIKMLNRYFPPLKYQEKAFIPLIIRGQRKPHAMIYIKEKKTVTQLKLHPQFSSQISDLNVCKMIEYSEFYPFRKANKLIPTVLAIKIE